jgi:hypothetical protein
VADVQILIQGSSVVERHRCFVPQRLCVGDMPAAASRESSGGCNRRRDVGGQ